MKIRIFGKIFFRNSNLEEKQVWANVLLIIWEHFDWELVFYKEKLQYNRFKRDIIFFGIIRKYLINFRFIGSNSYCNEPAQLFNSGEFNICNPLNDLTMYRALS